MPPEADYGLGTIGTCLGPPPPGGPPSDQKKKEEEKMTREWALYSKSYF